MQNCLIHLSGHATATLSSFWFNFDLNFGTIQVHLSAYISQHFLRFHWLKTPVKGMHENQVVANIQNAPDPEQAPEIWSLLGTLQPIA